MPLRIRVPAIATPPPSSTVVWIRVAGVWKQAVVWIRNNGVWKQATPYTRVSGAWK